MIRIGLLPFFRLCAALIFGILLYYYVPGISMQLAWAWALLSLAAIVALLLANWVPKPSQSWLKGFLLFQSLLWFGFLNAHYTANTLGANHFSKQEAPQILLVEIAENPIQKQKSSKCLAKVKAVYTNQWLVSDGQILLYFLDSFNSANVLGKQLIIKANKAQLIEGPKNPNQFDYAAFLGRKGIFHQAFLHNSDYYFSAHEPENSFSRTMGLFRQRLIENLAYLPQQTRAVAEALLLGYKENLDTETRNAFSKTGTMHILAVSGLHVGIIYMVLEKLLFFLFGFKNGWARFFKTALLLLGLWFYAILTGLPPSVMRAALMFSVVAIGNNILRPNNIYNNVLLSAFILLLFSPRLLFDLSFQLSYSAVFGIITFQPIFAKMIYVKNKILNFFWNLTTVSFAAQIATFPITLYYFHQMPIIFPISNLIAIPGAFLVVAIGGVLQVFSFFGGFLFQAIKLVYQFILFLLVEGVDVLSQLPFANIEKVGIANWDLALLYALILALSLAYFQKNKKWIYLAFALFFVEQAAYLLGQIKTTNAKEFVVFSHANQSLYGLKTQQHAVLASTEKNMDNYYFDTEGWLWSTKNIIKMDLNSDTLVQTQESIISNNLWLIQNVVIAFNAQKVQQPVNYYIFSNNADFSILPNVNADQCVFDSSVKPDWVLQKYPTFAQAHFVQRDGAFVKQF